MSDSCGCLDFAISSEDFTAAQELFDRCYSTGFLGLEQEEDEKIPGF